MATLVEFIHPVVKGTNRDRCLAVLLFAKYFESLDGLRAGDVAARLVTARVPHARKVNVSDVLGKAGHFVDGVPVEGSNVRVWKLTASGEEYIADLLGVDSAAHVVSMEISTLTALVAAISDEVVRGYVAESLVCLSAKALRATVVFLWEGAIRSLQESALTQKGGKAITAALVVHDSKARAITSIDSFAYTKESTFLLAARDLGLLDKGQHATLVEALNLRNRCGHPTKYRPGVKKVESFIEDVVGLCF